MEEVKILIENNLFSTAINRLYYAVYYAAMALLIKDGHIPSTHAGVRSMLGLHYIKGGIISQENGRNFMILFERRHRFDYDDFIEATFEEAEDLYPMAKSFVEEVDRVIGG